MGDCVLWKLNTADSMVGRAHPLHAQRNAIPDAIIRLAYRDLAWLAALLLFTGRLNTGLGNGAEVAR